MILNLPADDPDQFVLENSENLEEQLAHLTKELEANSKDDKKVSTLLVQRAIVFEKMQRIDQARSDIQTALLKDADNQEARQIFQRLLTTDSSVPAIEKNAEKKSTNPRAAQFQSYFQQVSSGNIPEVKKFVRSSGFVDVLAACGEQEADTESKSIAFMILTKIFNPPPNTEGYPMQTIIETCAQCFSKCIDSGKNAEKLLAYRTLGAILETGMTVGASILSQEGVVEEMIDVIDFEILPVQIAMTDVLATAASDKTCQKLIEKHASKWLAQTAKRSKDERLKASAGTALTKLQVQQRYQDNNIISSATNDNAEDALQNAMRQVDLGSTDLTDALMKTIKSYKNHDSSVVLNAVEGLAYSTLQPDVKESVASDPVLLKSLATLATDATNTNSNPLLFGIGTILSNTTMYKPVLDEQQKQMKRLRDLANAKSKGKPQEEEKEDEREKDEAVDRRVKAIVEQGISPVLLILAKNSSSNLKTVAAQTYFNLVTPQASRGKLLQQGVTKGLLPLALAKDSTYSPIAAQALAKLAITADPRIAFGSQTSLELVPPFLELCKDTEQLRQFEGLMALTNLASVDDNVRFRIYSDEGMPIFENLQLSNNDMVQRAATEMICNMTFCQPVFENYSKSPNRLRLLLILSDHEDVATRKAASGALAILANSKDTCERLANVDKAYERMVRLLDANEPADVQHRGIEIVRLMIENLGKEAAQAFAKEHANDMLVLIVTQSNVNVVRSAAMEVLKIFVKHGVPVKN